MRSELFNAVAAGAHERALTRLVVSASLGGVLGGGGQ